jgi:RNA polymerase sporulation-specific sigma factor
MKTNNSKEKIINDYDKIVKFVIKDMRLGYKFDELYDIATIGFVRGINSYDESKGFTYMTYLYECIKNEIMKHLHYEKQKKKDAELVSLNMIIGENTELQDMLGYDTDYIQDNYRDEILDIINDRISFMTKRQQLIVNHLYGLNGYEQMTQSEIARKYGLTKQNIYLTNKKIIRQLRHILMKYRMLG